MSGSLAIKCDDWVHTTFGADPRRSACKPVANDGNPFDMPDVQVEVEGLAVEVVRTLAMAQAEKAYTDFQLAVTHARDMLRSKADKAADDEKATLGIILAVAMVPAGLMMTAAGKALSGEMLQPKLLAGIKAAGPRLATLARFSDPAAITNAVYEKAASDAVTKLGKKFTPEKATAAVASAATALSGIAANIKISEDRFVNGANYLSALLKAASTSMNTLLKSIAGASTFDAALGFYNTFSAANISIYQAQVDQQSEDFMDQIAAPAAAKIVPKGKPLSQMSPDVIVQVDAYGRLRYAHARTSTDYDQFSPVTTYVFVSWVTPAMESAAAAQKPKLIKAADFTGHVPDPEREPTDGKDHNRIVRMDAFGQMRLVQVSIGDESGVFSTTKYGVMTFVSWVAEDETAEMEAKGAQQNGGINTVSPGDVQQLKTPS